MAALEGVEGRKEAEDPLSAVDDPNELLPRGTVILMVESLRPMLVVEPIRAAMMAAEDGLRPCVMTMFTSLTFLIADVSTPPLVSLQFDNLLVTEIALLSSLMLSWRTTLGVAGPVSMS